MKNRAIRERYAALFTLSRRALPSVTAVNKVAFLMERYGPAFRTTERALEACFTTHPMPKDLGDDAKVPEWLAEARLTFNNGVLEQDTPISKKVPDRMRLTSADMPRALSGEDGAKNAAGLAEIRYMLGGLYVKTGDEVVDDAEAGEETE